jgi:hypothetical protein
METEQELRVPAKRRADAKTGLNRQPRARRDLATQTHYPWFLWPMLGWGIGIAGHIFAVWLGLDREFGRRELDRELDRLHAPR